LSLRHPSYDRLVEEFIERDPLGPARRRLDEARLRAEAGPFRLLVSLAARGGVERFVQDRCAAIEASSEITLVLRPDGVAGKVRLTAPKMALDDLVYDVATELGALMDLVRTLAPTQLELHHFLGHAPGLIEALMDIGCESTIYIHDYSWICPRLTLLGGQGRYCGEPALEDCETCISTHGSSLEADLSVADLRKRSALWLARAQRIVMPTRDTADRMSRYFQLRGDVARVEAWESEAFPPVPAPATATDRVKVAIIGAVGDQKGYGVVLACATDAVARQLPIDFVLLGFTEHDSELMAPGNVFISGRFETDELDGLIRREAPHVALFASVTPETWCYSLTDALRARLPVVAFDLGAIAERLRAVGTNAELLPIDSEAAAVNNAILSIAGRQNRTREANSDLEFLQDPPIDEVRDAVGETGRRVGELMTEASIGLTATVQLLTLNKGLYRFSVQSATPSRPVDDSDVILPAVHVAVAPGTPAQNAEFMNGLRGEGSWLYDQTDVLIVKAIVSGTSIMVTSYGARGLGSLSIDVERIDVRRPPPEQVAAEIQPALAAPTAPPTPEPMLIASPGPRFEDGRRILAMQVKAHISMRGDVAFTNVDWAGDVDERLPVEAFSILPLEGLSPEDIEYRGLTAQGFETPWVSGGELCGQRQQALPLSGFAVRLKGNGGERFDCRYRGLFRSGAVIGPGTDSALLQSDSLKDYLIAIQISIGELPAAIAGTAEEAPEEDFAPHVVEPEPPPAPIGPRFSVFRQEAG
jgi:glycosyltransferase involved in cell wall biosynthesis